MAAFSNLVELAEASVERFADRPLFGDRHNSAWTWQTYRRWQTRVDSIRAVLADLGVGPGDRVAIISRNSGAWAAAAYATYGLGATFVPMFELQRPDEWEFMLRDSAARVVFARTQEIERIVEGMQPRLPHLRHVLAIEDPISLSLLESRATPVPAIHPEPDEVAGLIYTAGTTGQPKGVMLTHGNLTSNVLAALAVFPVGPHDRFLSFMPWAHVYGQVAELHSVVAAGASTAFNTNVERLLEDLESVQPTILVAVPRIFNWLYTTVKAKLASRTPLVRHLFDQGLADSKKRRRGESLTIRERVTLWFAGFLFAAVRRKLGGRLRYAITGSATLSLDVAETLDAMGIAIYEGYGLTETSPIVSFNTPGHRRLGSVGRPLAGVRIEIDEAVGESPGEGELIIHGPNVMKGYHARAEDNAEVFTADGGLRTGDLGRVDSDGFVFITGRLKEAYKLETGKYIMPAPLEQQLALSPYIANVMLHGAGKPYNVALVAIDTSRVRAWGRREGLDLAADLTSDLRVRRLILGELARYSADFNTYERPAEVVITQAPFSVENGLLTPTFKLKRREVARRFGSALEAAYMRLRTEPHVLVVPAPLIPPPQDVRT
jgi:long-chain acyl-CoA synthetase